MPRHRTIRLRSGPNPPSIVGQKFGRLTVVEQAGKNAKGNRQWLCRCDCGNERIIPTTNLTCGNTTSCGCYVAQITGDRNRTHGRSKTPEYRIWGKIVNRCCCPTAHNYSFYGGRGIEICPRWRESFEAFFEDMGPRPSPKHEIDRIDTFGHYEPGNCRWTTKKVQSRNTRSNRFEEHCGVIMCVAEWAEILGVPQYIFRNRARHGHSVQDTIRDILRRKREDLGHILHA